MAMIWLSTVCPERGPMCQRLARTASPRSMAPRISPSSISVRLARTARGSRKSGTPLAMASTPVSALQPGGEGLEDEQDRHRFEPGGGQLRGPGLGLVQAQRMDQPDHNDGEQPHDEHHRRAARRPGPSRPGPAS